MERRLVSVRTGAQGRIKAEGGSRMGGDELQVGAQLGRPGSARIRVELEAARGWQLTVT